MVTRLRANNQQGVLGGDYATGAGSLVLDTLLPVMPYVETGGTVQAYVPVVVNPDGARNILWLKGPADNAVQIRQYSPTNEGAGFSASPGPDEAIGGFVNATLAGSMLIAMIATDADPGSWTPPAGWTAGPAIVNATADRWLSVFHADAHGIVGAGASITFTAANPISGAVQLYELRNADTFGVAATTAGVSGDPTCEVVTSGDADPGSLVLMAATPTGATFVPEIHADLDAPNPLPPWVAHVRGRNGFPAVGSAYALQTGVAAPVRGRWSVEPDPGGGCSIAAAIFAVTPTTTGATFTYPCVGGREDSGDNAALTGDTWVCAPTRLDWLASLIATDDALLSNFFGASLPDLLASLDTFLTGLNTAVFAAPEAGVEVDTITADADIFGRVTLVDASGGAVTASLRDPTGYTSTGKLFYVKRIDSTTANAVTVDATASTIDGAASLDLPAQWDWIAVYCDGANYLLVASSLPGGDAAWHEVGAGGEPAFTGGWGNFGSGYETVAFRIDHNGFVHLKGVAGGGTADSSHPIFTLPATRRPGATTFNGVVSGGGTGVCQIQPTGQVEPEAGSSSSFGLSGITFFAEN